MTGIDGVFSDESMLAELTSIIVPKRRMAGLAVERLIRRIDGVGGPPQKLIEPHGFRFGTSCGSRPRPSLRKPLLIPNEPSGVMT